jgi:DNA-binding transcriptional LysR family regulator
VRDLNDLSFFAAVVAHGGFSAAGRATGVPKSRISRRVAALEAQLGVRLVERSTRRFKVTDVGAEVYRHARAALNEAEAIDHVVSRLTAEPQGLVRISCPLDADRLLGAALPAFLVRHPRLRVQVMVTNRRIDLIEEDIDVAIRVRDRLDTDPDLHVRIIGSAASLLVASPALVATYGQPADPAEIAALPTLGHVDRPGGDRWTVVNAAGEEATVLHEPRLSASTFPLLRQAAIDGVGVGLLPEWSCREPLADGRLVRILPAIEFMAEVLHPRSAVWDVAV